MVCFSQRTRIPYANCKLASDNWHSGFVFICTQSYQSSKFLYIPMNVGTSLTADKGKDKAKGINTTNLAEWSRSQTGISWREAGLKTLWLVVTQSATTLIMRNVKP